MEMNQMVVDLTESPPSSPLLTLPASSNPIRVAKSKQPPTYMGPKKLVIKNLRSVPRADPNQYFDQVWKQLEAALSSIFRGTVVPYSLEDLYKGVETLCRQDRGPLLYKRLAEKCKNELTLLLKDPLVKEANSMEDSGVLRAVVDAWSTWNAQLATIRSIFFYLDRSYLLRSKTQSSIEDMGIGEFRSIVFSDARTKPRAIRGACDLLNTARQKRQSGEDENLFRRAVQLFHRLGVYNKEFEPNLLAESERFLLAWAEEMSNRGNLAEYVMGCEELFKDEAQRCESYGLDPSTMSKLQSCMEEILVQSRQDQLLKSEDVSLLLLRGDLITLKALYTLLQLKQLGEKLGKPLEGFIIKQGSDIVFDEEHEHDMVVRLLEFKRKLNHIWEQAFQANGALGHTLREAFESFINKSKRSNMTWGTDNPKPGEMIAKYVDMILRGGKKAIPAHTLKREANNQDMECSSEDEDAEITKQLDQVLDLFRFVHGKAVFEAFYKRDLARRLLLGRSSSADAEKSMLTRLKSECGAGFTHNLEQMFKDIELAREENSSYKSLLEESHTSSAIDLNVNVLSASAWPSYPDMSLEIPRDIQTAIAGFEKFYKFKHSGRKLTWKHALAHCQLKARYPKGDKEIVVSSFQAIVLLLFNQPRGSENMSYSEIQGATNLDESELKRTLQSLACAKYRVLTKTPRGRDVSNSDSFAVNLNFSDPKYRIKINQIQAKETKEENKETHERVVADRNYETQAAIVRIMKSRKTITHAELVSEVISATKNRGPLDPTDIKKNIEKLIEKDYMEREENSDGRNVYSYLA